MELERTARRESPLRLLFLCTGNSARCQIGEAILSRKGRGRFVVASAGSQPVSRVNPLTIDVLREFNIDWGGREPKGIDYHGSTVGPDYHGVRSGHGGLSHVPRATGGRALGHAGPAAVVGTDENRRQAFREMVQYLSRRIDLLLALPVEKLERLALEQRVRAIADQAVTPTPQREHER